MKITKESIEQYVDAKEYIDTLLIPLVSLNIKNDQSLIKSASEREYLNVLTYELEKHLTGRLLLLPEYVYFSDATNEKEVNRLNEWIQTFKTYPFEHVFLMTLDMQWRKQEADLDGTLLWLPSVTIDHIRSAEMQAVVQDQVGQLGDLIRSSWEND